MGEVEPDRVLLIDRLILYCGCGCWSGFARSTERAGNAEGLRRSWLSLTFVAIQYPNLSPIWTSSKTTLRWHTSSIHLFTYRWVSNTIFMLSSLSFASSNSSIGTTCEATLKRTIHFTDDAVELLQTKLNLTPNDNDLRVAQMLMKWTSPALFDQDGHLTNNAVKLFERRLQTSRKDGLNPNDNDVRVTGMLMKWTSESKDITQYNAPTAVLPSFPRVKSFILARVPQLNNSVEESTRLRNLRMKTLLARKFVYFCLQMHREESSCSIFWHRAGSIPRDNWIGIEEVV